MAANRRYDDRFASRLPIHGRDAARRQISLVLITAILLKSALCTKRVCHTSVWQAARVFGTAENHLPRRRGRIIRKLLSVTPHFVAGVEITAPEDSGRLEMAVER